VLAKQNCKKGEKERETEPIKRSSSGEEIKAKLLFSVRKIDFIACCVEANKNSPSNR
jgi:hypothetical protein